MISDRNRKIIESTGLDQNIRYQDAYQFLEEDDTYWLRLATGDIFLHTIKDRECEKCGELVTLQHLLESFCFINLR